MDKTEITPELLAELKEKAEKATPGPWEAISCAICLPEQNNEQKILGGFNDYDDEENNKYAFGYNNAQFVAIANPQVTLALIAKIEQIEKEYAWLLDKEAASHCPHSCPVEDAPSLEECVMCWREAARKAVEEKCKSN